MKGPSEQPMSHRVRDAQCNCSVEQTKPYEPNGAEQVRSCAQHGGLKILAKEVRIASRD